jgi:hypothetical protein
MAKDAITATRFEMKPRIEAMLPKSDVVKMSDPEKTGVDPVPDDVASPSSQTEAYSEGGLSGEATVNRGEDQETEPFMLRQRSDEEIAEYDKGLSTGQKGGRNDDTKSQAWQRGWAEAQE